VTLSSKKLRSTRIQKKMRNKREMKILKNRQNLLNLERRRKINLKLLRSRLFLNPSQMTKKIA